jgi:Integrase core domain
MRPISDAPQLTSDMVVVPVLLSPFRAGTAVCTKNSDSDVVVMQSSVVPTITFQQLFAFLVLGHERRRLLSFAVTRNPTAEWLARQITEAFPWDTAPKYLIRDNDRAFGVAFKARVRAMGIRDRPTSYDSPWQNGYVERLIDSIRRECTDHLLVFNVEHHRRILSKYASYYNEARTHCSGRTRPADGQSNNLETLSRIQSLADYTIDTLESSFQKRQLLATAPVRAKNQHTAAFLPGQL